MNYKMGERLKEVEFINFYMLFYFSFFDFYRAKIKIENNYI